MADFLWCKDREICTGGQKLITEIAKIVTFAAVFIYICSSGLVRKSVILSTE